jgi:acyl dehydratase
MAFEIKQLCNLVQRRGEEIGVSDWLQITQAQVNAFAEVTMDPDWMHIDVERARHGPVGQTIGQGFLTLSLLLYFSHQMRYLPSDRIAHAFNYGLNRVRWLAPVPVGARIRNRALLIDALDRGEGDFLITTDNYVEIEGHDKPAMVAQWLGLVREARVGSTSAGSQP